MKKIIRSGAFLGMVMLLGILSSCEKDYYTPETVDIPQNISYSGDIQPFWDADCVKCHKAGSTAPNLEAGSSYNAIVPSLVNTGDPASSKIYTKIASGGSMYKYVNPPGKEALVLKWIEQGAQDN